MINNYNKIVNDVRNIVNSCHRNLNEVQIVAVSKGFSVDQIFQVYKEGCRNFGENRVQEAVPKIELSPRDIDWHFIGRLQQNKVKKAVGRFHLFHSVDSKDLVYQISKESEQVGTTSNILLQINTSGEMTKQGFTVSQCKEEFEKIISYPHLSVRGLMTMAPLTEDRIVIRDCFRRLHDLKYELSEGTGYPLLHLSMGMSYDYGIAIEEGATILRIGRAIFGTSSGFVT